MAREQPAAERHVTVRVPAKINLYLRVGGVRPDGYHDLTTVYQAVSLYDELTLSAAPRLAVTVRGEAAGVPTDKDNLAARAARLAAKAGRVPLGVRVEIDKSIPVAGGMAGGSADAAAALVAADAAAWRSTGDGAGSARFAEVLAACEVEFTEELLAARCTPWQPHTFIDPSARETLAALRSRGVKVGLLSNTLWPRSQHEKWLARDGVLDLFDGAVFSSELAWMKPHPEAFRAAMAAVGVRDPARVVFVGDRPYEDIHGAKSVGMRAVLVPHSRIPEDQRGPVEGEADAIISVLLDLVPLVDEWNAAARNGC
jgi:putative hydrolase of the HAD superfamily